MIFAIGDASTNQRARRPAEAAPRPSLVGHVGRTEAESEVTLSSIEPWQWIDAPGAVVQMAT